MAHTTDQQELDNLENVMLSMAFADSTEKLQRAINSFLTPVLHLLRSQHQTTRAKVIEVLTHFSKRIKSDSQIKLPTEKLIQQFKDPASLNLQINFILVYIQLAFHRSTPEVGLKSTFPQIWQIINHFKMYFTD